MGQLVRLFEPGRIGRMELENRLVMGPLGHGMTYATKEGTLTDQFLAFYEARARGGVGFIQLTVAALARPYAGIAGRGGLFANSDEASWDELIEVNVTGMLNCTRQILPSMLAKGTGRSSISPPASERAAAPARPFTRPPKGR